MESHVDEDTPGDVDMETKYPLLPFEKQIFIDVQEKDSLLIMAKGLNYDKILANMIWVYNNPGNLVLIINSIQDEEKLFTKKFNLASLPNTGVEREKRYLEGGVVFATTRILVVDLLKNRVPVTKITGIIVLRAHTVLESCQEAFVLRLYRQQNKTGFIKAFSNSPISFTFGYNQVEKVMRALFVTELFLWPRFHGLVIKSLKSREAEVVEIQVPLTAKASQIQMCLLDIMNYIVKQLKSNNKTIDIQEITMENCITKNFHKILQSQLDCIWHQLSTKTKEYIQDLKVLRSLIIYLFHYDPVSFYALIQKYKTPEYAKVNSGWILMDSAEQLFEAARGRVYNNKDEFDPEHCPKWKCLTDLLTQEIPEEVKNKGTNTVHNTKVLILCQDDKTCSQLNNYLIMGPEKYLFYKAFCRKLNIKKVSSKYQDTKESVFAESEEDEPKSKKDGADDEDQSVDEIIKSFYVLTLNQPVESENTTDESMFEPLSQLDDVNLTEIETENPLIFIQPFKPNGNMFSLGITLETYQPDYIILYHSDMFAVRQIELFECRKKPEEPKTKVYFIMHDKTVEEQVYLASLKREKQAFELLIETKGVMVIPSYQDGKTDEYFNLNTEAEENVVDTRKAGGQDVKKEKPLVIVDMREFRSDLPALLHKKGVNIEPVTITIGDYILTPDICVERKSISDLIGSLNSGRLYTQCTQMCRNYSCPILLIEFDPDQPFHLQGSFNVATEVSGPEIEQKLQLLTIHFPKLKMVWSPSNYATVELFCELKQGRKNPNIEEAIALSSENTMEDIFERYNIQVHDFVRRLPGITSKNITRMMNKGQSLEHLITLTKEQITEILENKVEAEMLYSILHMKPTSDQSKDEHSRAKRKFAEKLFKTLN